MPNSYEFRRMSAAEFIEAKREAGLSDGEFQKIAGRHFNDLGKIRAGEIDPRHVEAVVLDYLAAHPDRKGDMVAVANARAVNPHKSAARAARRAHLQRTGEDSA